MTGGALDLRRPHRAPSIAPAFPFAIGLPTMPSESATDRLKDLLGDIDRAAGRSDRPVRLLAVSKTRSADEVAALAAAGQRAFGENYVQEGMAKARALQGLDLEWHLIGPLQSNKSRDAAHCFDWIQSIDREKPLALLDRHRPPGRPPLNLLIQVNIDDEDSKSGCAPEQVDRLATAIAGHSRLRLRGLMAIPAPHPDPARRRAAFAAMHRLFETLRADRPAVDTLSMGMSDDFELAIEQGATMVRVGTALFGPRPPAMGSRE
jgi:PLP dependent protein